MGSASICVWGLSARRWLTACLIVSCSQKIDIRQLVDSHIGHLGSDRWSAIVEETLLRGRRAPDGAFPLTLLSNWENTGSLPTD